MSSLIKNIVLILCLVILVIFVYNFLSNVTTYNEGFTPYIRGKYRENVREIKKYSIDKAMGIQNSSTRFLRSVGFI